MISRLKKLSIMLLIALGAIAAATVHGVIMFPEMEVRTAGLDNNDAEMVRMPVIFESCVVFFTVLHFLGRRLPLWIGDEKSARMLDAAGAKHLRLLHGFGGALIIGSRYLLSSYHFPLWQNVLMITFGICLIISAFKKHSGITQNREKSPCDVRSF